MALAAPVFHENYAQMGVQGDLKIEEFRGLFAPPPQDPPKDTKWTQNDSKMEPRWIQNGVKMEPQSNENE